ncbi:hypothetical protein MPSEU_000011400 [Mayamaea pseudoterrestris]|nr:hypothetical protein MPSEU_000011400 [Mayamaea pseudoterrestris]
MSPWWARPLLKTAQGATITFGSTIISCALALQVEQSANRLFFYWMPHKYASVDRAYGLTQEQLDSVRYLRRANENESQRPLAVMEQQQTQPLRDEDWSRSEESIRDIQIGFSNETLFSLDAATKQSREALPLPQLWQQDVIACSMTG